MADEAKMVRAEYGLVNSAIDSDRAGLGAGAPTARRRARRVGPLPAIAGIIVGAATVGAPVDVVSAAATAIAPGDRACFEVDGDPGDVAVVNLTPVEASGAGNGQLVSSDVDDPPTAANVNFRPGSVDPNVAFAEIGADGQVCFVNAPRSWVHVVADQLGTIATDDFAFPSADGAADRVLDTRTGIGGNRIGPGGRVCFDVAGAVGDVAVVNLTPVDPAGHGNGQLVSSDVDEAPTAANVNFRPGAVDPNVALAAIGTDGRVCFFNSRHSAVDLVADQLGTLADTAYQPARDDGAPRRVTDTRTGSGAVGPSARHCFAVAGETGDVAVVNLTPVEASGSGNGQLVSSDVADPATAANVNFRPGSVDPNVAFAAIGADGRVCFVNSHHASVHVVADHLGTIAAASYAPADPDGAPVRVLDTRVGTTVDQHPDHPAFDAFHADALTRYGGDEIPACIDLAPLPDEDCYQVQSIGADEAVFDVITVEWGVPEFVLVTRSGSVWTATDWTDDSYIMVTKAWAAPYKSTPTPITGEFLSPRQVVYWTQYQDPATIMGCDRPEAATKRCADVRLAHGGNAVIVYHREAGSTVDQFLWEVRRTDGVERYRIYPYESY